MTTANASYTDITNETGETKTLAIIRAGRYAGVAYCATLTAAPMGAVFVTMTSRGDGTWDLATYDAKSGESIFEKIVDTQYITDSRICA